MQNDAMAVVLSLPYLSEVLTDQALIEGAINDNDTLLVKTIEWDETRKCYIADCSLYKETFH